MDQELRKCGGCHSTMQLNTTYFEKNRKGEWFKTCTKCRERQRKQKKTTYAQIKEKTNTPEIKAKHRLAVAKYRAANVEKCRLDNKKYREEKRDYCEHNARKRQCKICHPRGYLKMLVGARIREALKCQKSKKSFEYLGCDIETYRVYLEGTFKEGMTWENQGEWEIDHIIPVAYKQDGVEPSIEEVERRLHYTNTQAMWAAENRAKGDRHIG